MRFFVEFIKINCLAFLLSIHRYSLHGFHESWNVKKFVKISKNHHFNQMFQKHCHSLSLHEFTPPNVQPPESIHFYRHNRHVGCSFVHSFHSTVAPPVQDNVPWLFIVCCWLNSRIHLSGNSA